MGVMEYQGQEGIQIRINWVAERFMVLSALLEFFWWFCICPVRNPSYAQIKGKHVSFDETSVITSLHSSRNAIYIINTIEINEAAQPLDV